MDRWIFALICCVLSAGLTPADEPETVTFVERLVAQTQNLRPEVLELAFDAYAEGLETGRVTRKRLTVIDYSLPSFEERLWVIDMETATVIYEEIVAHGMGSPRGSGGDLEQATSFSNLHGSKKSSLGFFITAETYVGHHGYTLKLDGLEEGVNDNARDRLIVLHSAHYVTEDRAENHLVGRSWGCPVVRPEVSKELIDAIRDGSALWIYYPDEKWLAESNFLDED